MLYNINKHKSEEESFWKKDNFCSRAEPVKCDDPEVLGGVEVEGGYQIIRNKFKKRRKVE
jgi:hypothetical protein